MGTTPNVSIRVNRTSGYTAMSTHHLRNPMLSLKAKGLLSSLLASPPGWTASVAGYAKTCKDGKAAITSAIKELEDAGYVVRRRIHDDKGHFVGMEYVVFEHPVHPQTEEQPLSENQKMDDDSQPFADFPAPENPAPENQPQYNIYLSNIDQYTPLTPQGEGPGAKDLFPQFWDAYPKKTAKQNAARAWKKLGVTAELFGTIMAALDQAKRSGQWQRENGRYIPYPATWLNGRRWEDEHSPIPPVTPPGDDLDLF